MRGCVAALACGTPTAIRPLPCICLVWSEHRCTRLSFLSLLRCSYFNGTMSRVFAAITACRWGQLRHETYLPCGNIQSGCGGWHTKHVLRTTQADGNYELHRTLLINAEHKYKTAVGVMLSAWPVVVPAPLRLGWRDAVSPTHS